MNENLKEIRSGFLRSVGAVPIAVILAVLAKPTTEAIGLKLSDRAVWTMRATLIAAGIVWIFGTWMVSYFRNRRAESAGRLYLTHRIDECKKAIEIMDKYKLVPPEEIQRRIRESRKKGT
jgi:hypothetical protein